MARRKRTQGRFGRWFERIALGAVMGAVAFVAERRLLKVIRRRDTEPERPGAGDARPGAELALPAEKVGDQAAGQ